MLRSLCAVASVAAVVAVAGGGVSSSVSARPDRPTAERAAVVRLDAVWPRRTGPITAHVPASVETGTVAEVTGKVPVSRSVRTRIVHLYERDDQGRFAPLLRYGTDLSGRYDFRVQPRPGDVDGTTRTFKVEVGRTGALKALTSTTVTFRYADPEPLGPPAVPLGSATDWTWLGGVYDTARWNPCAPITWRFNPDGGYAGSLADWQASFAAVASYTGLTFDYLGTTDYVYHDGGLDRPEDADILIAWTDAQHAPDLQGDGVQALGIGGGGNETGLHGYDVDYEIENGIALLNENQIGRHIVPGFDAKNDMTWGQVMEHELLHVLGLGHAADDVEVMYPYSQSTNHYFGAGDIAGMERIGAADGCLDPDVIGPNGLG